MKPEYFLIVTLFALPIALTLLMYALHWALDKWGYPSAIRAFKQLGLPEPVVAEAIACFDDARQRQRKTWWYDASAPLVTLIALMFTPRDANKLPAWASRWDNNVSLNGDGHGWQDLETGEWFDTRVKPAPEGVPLVSHNDPAYGGDCYYARGHHPRSFWARWVWVGWRNRASKLSLGLGEYVNARPAVDFAEPAELAGRSRDGHYLLRHGHLYQWRQYERRGPIVVIRNLGFKLEHVMYSASGQGMASAVAIGISFKRWRA